MIRLAKYLKPYTFNILAVIALLFVQAYADLALPEYMSRIVNYGIQMGGVENAVPLAMRESNMERVFIFLSPEDKAAVLNDYTLVDANSSNYAETLKTYPGLAKEAVYVRKPIDQAEIERGAHGGPRRSGHRSGDAGGTVQRDRQRQ